MKLEKRDKIDGRSHLVALLLIVAQAYAGGLYGDTTFGTHVSITPSVAEPIEVLRGSNITITCTFTPIGVKMEYIGIHQVYDETDGLVFSLGTLIPKKDSTSAYRDVDFNLPYPVLPTSKEATVSITFRNVTQSSSALHQWIAVESTLMTHTYKTFWIQAVDEVTSSKSGRIEADPGLPLSVTCTFRLRRNFIATQLGVCQMGGGTQKECLICTQYGVRSTLASPRVYADVDLACPSPLPPYQPNDPFLLKTVTVIFSNPTARLSVQHKCSAFSTQNEVIRQDDSFSVIILGYVTASISGNVTAYTDESLSITCSYWFPRSFSVLKIGVCQVFDDEETEECLYCYQGTVVAFPEKILYTNANLTCPSPGPTYAAPVPPKNVSVNFQKVDSSLSVYQKCTAVSVSEVALQQRDSFFINSLDPVASSVVGNVQVLRGLAFVVTCSYRIKGLVVSFGVCKMLYETPVECILCNNLRTVRIALKNYVRVDVSDGIYQNTSMACTQPTNTTAGTVFNLTVDIIFSGTSAPPVKHACGVYKQDGSFVSGRYFSIELVDTMPVYPAAGAIVARPAVATQAPPANVAAAAVPPATAAAGPPATAAASSSSAAVTTTLAAAATSARGAPAIEQTVSKTVSAGFNAPPSTTAILETLRALETSVGSCGEPSLLWLYVLVGVVAVAIVGVGIFLYSRHGSLGLGHSSRLDGAASAPAAAAGSRCRPASDSEEQQRRQQRQTAKTTAGEPGRSVLVCEASIAAKNGQELAAARDASRARAADKSSASPSHSSATTSKVDSRSASASSRGGTSPPPRDLEAATRLKSSRSTAEGGAPAVKAVPL